VQRSSVSVSVLVRDAKREWMQQERKIITDVVRN